jgi:hypothetical protein
MNVQLESHNNSYMGHFCFRRHVWIDMYGSHVYQWMLLKISTPVDLEQVSKSSYVVIK